MGGPGGRGGKEAQGWGTEAAAVTQLGRQAPPGTQTLPHFPSPRDLCASGSISICLFGERIGEIDEQRQ